MFKLDFIDQLIIEFVKSLPSKVIPLKFTGELACINGAMQGIFFMFIVGEIIVLMVKAHEDKKKVKLFGLKRND